MSGLTTFKIGGPAKLFARPADVAQLQEITGVARRRKLPVLVLGAGSNILCDDAGCNALVVRLDAPAFTTVQAFGTRVIAGSGVPLARLAAYCARKGLGGLEFLAGIPGTVGGAIAMNAGIRDKDRTRQIADSVECAWVLDYNNNVAVCMPEELGFAYRSCALGRRIVLAVRFSLKRIDPAKSNSRIADFRARRRASQDWSLPSAGCVFRNPAGDSAGRLIDSCGLKGRRIGRAQISRRHANFIVNTGHASSADVLALMKLARSEVNKRYHIRLEPEIKLWK